MAAVAAIVGGVATAVGGAVQAGKAHKEMRKARSAKNEAKFKMEQAILDRRDITNPYAGVTDLSGLASDLSSQITNPFNNLTVSTAAAEMKAEETDIALANTLDTLRATGASAGGATALARMALESKKGVSASIEQQEAQNQKLRASGEQQLQQVQLNEARRVQAGLMGEAKRMQDVEVQAKDLEFRRKEQREMEQLDRKQAQITGAAAQEASARAQKAGAINAGIGAVGNIASAGLAAGIAKG